MAHVGLSDEGKLELEALLTLVEAMPLVISVKHSAGNFNVAHAELVSKSRGEVVLLSDTQLNNEPLLAELEGRITWGRSLSGPLRRDHASLDDDGLLVLPNAWELGLSLTYVGHTIFNRPCLYRSHLFTDMGAYRDDSKLWLINHQEMAMSLDDSKL